MGMSRLLYVPAPPNETASPQTDLSCFDARASIGTSGLGRGLSVPSTRTPCVALHVRCVFRRTFCLSRLAGR